VLLLAHVDSPDRLNRFLGFFVAVILVPIVLAVLNYHGYVEIPAFRVLSEFDGLRRLCGTGIFGDPNDVCEILNFGMIVCLVGLFDRGAGFSRLLWLAPLATFGHTLTLTHSRGGLLGAVVGLAVLLRSRFKGARVLFAGVAVLAIALAFAGGRQTTFSTSEGTSQTRIQLWDDGFQMLRRSPLLGVGIEGFVNNSSHAAHNTFIQAYAELGLLGGTLLFGQYFWCLINLAKLGSAELMIPDSEIRRLQPFIFASLAGFATSEMSLTHPFSIITYLMFGLATICVRLANTSPALADLEWSGALVKKTAFYSILFLAALFAFTKFSVRYN
jgi:O-antigen ligase